jgi:uncharacterized protein (DUF1501 family)
MRRRQLLKNMAAASIATGMGSLAFPLRALADCSATSPDMDKTLVNFMLSGGADMRFVFMPAPGVLDPVHEGLMFSARQSLYPDWRADDTLSYFDVFHTNYDIPFGEAFGIHKSCGWLTSQFEQGRVAVIANAFCSRNRRHDQSILNANAGEPGFNELIYNRDGWGGRLVNALGSSANAVELGSAISVFSQGPDAGSRLDQVIHAQNTRDIALPDVDPVSGGGTGRHDIVTRALKSYYGARGPEVASEKSSNWPYHTFFNHNAAFREFGGAMNECMDARGDLPEPLNSLNLISNGFELQVKNLYDVCLAPDVLGARTISMGYGGWDTHGNQEFRAGRNLGDIFGTDKGLDTAMQAIAGIPSAVPGIPTNAHDQLTFYFASDFGRQIVANGDLGTDHGKGIYAILIGTDVEGGVYGDMFPPSEASDADGQIPLTRHGADITGLTTTEKILAEACEWVEPGTSSSVFPNAASSTEIETPGMLNDLFKTV